MSGEIVENYSANVNHGSYQETIAKTLTTVQTTEGGGNPGYVNIGTSEEDIAFGDVTPRVVIMENMDGTNFVKYGPKSGGSMVYFGRIAPGGFARLELGSGVTLRMVADTAGCNVRIRGYNA